MYDMKLVVIAGKKEGILKAGSASPIHELQDSL
jgi:hypothetical protein